MALFSAAVLMTVSDAYYIYMTPTSMRITYDNAGPEQITTRLSNDETDC